MESLKEICDAAKETYSNSDNTVEIFEIKSMLHDLQILFEIDILEEMEQDCLRDAAKYRKEAERPDLQVLVMAS